MSIYNNTNFFALNSTCYNMFAKIGMDKGNYHFKLHFVMFGF